MTRVGKLEAVRGVVSALVLVLSIAVSAWADAPCRVGVLPPVEVPFPPSGESGDIGSDGAIYAPTRAPVMKGGRIIVAQNVRAGAPGVAPRWTLWTTDGTRRATRTLRTVEGPLQHLTQGARGQRAVFAAIGDPAAESSEIVRLGGRGRGKPRHLASLGFSPSRLVSVGKGVLVFGIGTVQFVPTRRGTPVTVLIRERLSIDWVVPTARGAYYAATSASGFEVWFIDVRGRAHLLGTHPAGGVYSIDGTGSPKVFADAERIFYVAQDADERWTLWRVDGRESRPVLSTEAAFHCDSFRYSVFNCINPGLRPVFILRGEMYVLGDAGAVRTTGGGTGVEPAPMVVPPTGGQILRSMQAPFARGAAALFQIGGTAWMTDGTPDGTAEVPLWTPGHYFSGPVGVGPDRLSLATVDSTGRSSVSSVVFDCD